MREPRQIRWSGNGFQLSVARHSPWSALMGLSGVGAIGFGVLTFGAAVVAQTGQPVALLVAVLLGLGGVAGVATKLERTLAVVDVLTVDPVRVDIDGQSIAFEDVWSIGWERDVLWLRSARDTGIRIQAPRLQAEEREWLQHHLTELWEAHRARKGEVPQDLQVLRTGQVESS
jgi:hypothetical protein